MSGPAPDTRERKVLRNIEHQQWEYEAKLGCGPKIRADLLEKRWIELHPDYSDRYRITDDGRKALEMPVPKKPSGPKLKSLVYTTKPIDPLIKPIK
ncbi:MAG: hypothetical protein Q7R40_20105 [Phaeospirillum sp.]|nr:hypothetical protein [Phaeospirillum sp.]